MEETTKITIDEVKDFAFDVIGDVPIYIAP